jgi:hypothetical protein
MLVHLAFSRLVLKLGFCNCVFSFFSPDFLNSTIKKTGKGTHDHLKSSSTRESKCPKSFLHKLSQLNFWLMCTLNLLWLDFGASRVSQRYPLQHSDPFVNLLCKLTLTFGQCVPWIRKLALTFGLLCTLDTERWREFATNLCCLGAR